MDINIFNITLYNLYSSAQYLSILVKLYLTSVKKHKLAPLDI